VDPWARAHRRAPQILPVLEAGVAATRWSRSHRRTPAPRHRLISRQPIRVDLEPSAAVFKIETLLRF
jgi:hypothetical protein